MFAIELALSIIVLVALASDGEGAISPYKVGCGVAVFAVAAFFALSMVFGSFAQIDAGEVGVLTTWGKVEPNLLQPGFNFKMPFAQAVTEYEIRNQRSDVEAAAASRDLQEVNAKIAIIYHPSVDEVFKLHNETGIGYAQRVVAPAVQEAFKATTAQYTANELITKREEVKIKARDLLADRLERFHIKLEDINIVNFEFSKDFTTAIEQANVARQQVITAEQTLAKQRVEAQLRVAQAEADAAANIAQASGQATAKRTQAEADAFSIRAVAQATADGYTAQVRAFGSADNFVEYTRAKAWNGSVPSTVMGEGNSFLFGLNR